MKQHYAIRSIVAAVAVAAAITIGAPRGLADAPAVAEETIGLWLYATAFVIAGRIWLTSSERRARRRGDGGQRTLIVGAERRGARREETRRAPRGGTETGWVPRQGAAHGDDVTGLPVLGASWDLDGIVRDQQIEHVIVTFSTAPEEVHLRLLKRCDELGIATSLVPRLYEKSTEHVTSSLSAGFR